MPWLLSCYCSLKLLNHHQWEHLNTIGLTHLLHLLTNHYYLKRLHIKHPKSRNYLLISSKSFLQQTVHNNKTWKCYFITKNLVAACRKGVGRGWTWQSVNDYDNEISFTFYGEFLIQAFPWEYLVRHQSPHYAQPEWGDWCLTRNSDGMTCIRNSPEKVKLISLLLPLTDFLLTDSHVYLTFTDNPEGNW